MIFPIHHVVFVVARTNRRTPYLSLSLGARSLWDGLMPRIGRVVVPGYPHHITQRGNLAMMKDWRRSLRQPAPGDLQSPL